jgi:hypothetical protein
MIQQEFDFGFPNSIVIPDGSRFLKKENWNDTEEYFYLVSSKETESMVIATILNIRHIISCEKWITHINTERYQKFICINGPRAGNLLIEQEGKELGYIRYNCADPARRSKGWPRNVLVHSVFLTQTGMVQIPLDN